MKFLYLDCETTGLDPDVHGVLQVACIVTEGKTILEAIEVERFEVLFNPKSIGCKIDKEALKINGHKKKKIKKYPKDTFTKLLQFFGRYINGFDKEDKFIVVGQNVKFDIEFLHGWAKRENYDYMGSFVDWRVIDTLVIARLQYALGYINPPNFKLGTLCKEYGIDEPDHDAMTDIVATKKLLKAMLK